MQQKESKDTVKNSRKNSLWQKARSPFNSNKRTLTFSSKSANAQLPILTGFSKA